jgi:hypothetical protein
LPKAESVTARNIQQANKNLKGKDLTNSMRTEIN